jgi:hypothetical protein
MSYKNYLQRILEKDTIEDRIKFERDKNKSSLGSYISPFTDEIIADESIHPQGSFDYISNLEGLPEIFNQVIEEARKAGSNPEAYSSSMANAAKIGPQLTQDIFNLIETYKSKHDFTLNLISAFGKTNVKVYEILVNRLNAYTSRFNNLWKKFDTGLAMIYIEDLEKLKIDYSNLVNDLNAFSIYVQSVHEDPRKITELSSALPEQSGFLGDVRDILKYALYGGLVIIGWKITKPLFNKSKDKNSQKK